MTKRIFDFILSLNFIAIAILPMILIAIIIKISSTGPVIFWSLRSGSNNSTFNMPKFRTMFLDSPYVASNLLEDKHRYITPFGSFLRKTSLDELPQLWSILIGKMSFVGPRPELPKYTNIYNKYERKILTEKVNSKEQNKPLICLPMK